MADEAETTENDELLLTEEVEPEAPETDEQPQTEEPDDEEEVFAFGDEPTEPQDGDSGLVKHLREELKRARKEAADAKKAVPEPEPEEEIGPEPQMWDDGIDGDDEKLKAAIRAYDKRVAARDARKREKADAAQAQQQAWENELKAVAEEKTALAKDDADDAFETVRATLGDQMNALVIHAVDKGNRARLIYALAKNPSRLEALANINGAADPIRFIKEVAKLEGQLKMVKRRKAPDPDTPERPSATASRDSSAAQKQLDKMEADWERKGGDRRPIIEFKRKHGLK
jgi:hypothetical protein